MVSRSSVFLDSRRPFLIDPVSGAVLTYGRLLGVTSGDGSDELPLFLFYRCLVSGLLEGKHLTVGRDAGLLLSGEEAGEMDCHKVGEPINHLHELRQAMLQSTATLKLFTSGTTGRPSAVTHPLSRLMSGVRFGSHHEEDVWGLAYSPSHIAGLLVFLQAFLNGNTMVLLHGLPPEAVLDSIEGHAVTHVPATPTFYRLLPPRDRELDSVQRLTFGGEALDSSLRAKMKGLFPKAKFLNIYASTEVGSLMEARDEVFHAPSELGDKTKVVNGELLLHRSLLGKMSGDSQPSGDWYATGDLVRESKHGIQFEGRKCQEINTGGYKVNPLDVERLVRALPGVKDCRVFGRDSSVLGQILCCQVVALDQGASTEKEIRERLAVDLPSHSIPRIWEFVDVLGMTASGKRLLKSDE